MRTPWSLHTSPTDHGTQVSAWEIGSFRLLLCGHILASSDVIRGMDIRGQLRVFIHIDIIKYLRNLKMSVTFSLWESIIHVRHYLGWACRSTFLGPFYSLHITHTHSDYHKCILGLQEVFRKTHEISGKMPEPQRFSSVPLTMAFKPCWVLVASSQSPGHQGEEFGWLVHFADRSNFLEQRHLEEDLCHLVYETSRINDVGQIFNFCVTSANSCQSVIYGIYCFSWAKHSANNVPNIFSFVLQQLAG